MQDHEKYLFDLRYIVVKTSAPKLQICQLG